jgi:uncharacterized protein (TIGR03437 family)
MRLLLATSLFTLAAAAQELPHGVDLVQRIDQSYSWLNVLAFDVDAQGNTYLAGSALGAIPVSVNIRFGPLGGTDIVVIKVDPTGRQIYGTAIGGSRDDIVGGIKTDSAGNVYLFGSTNSPDYPAIGSQGSGTAAVALKLDPTGSILYNSRLNWAAAILTMGVDMAGDLYIGGIPQPGQLPVSSGAYRQASDGSGGFVAELDQSGNLETATYIEGQVLNVVMRQDGDVLFSMGKTIAALDGSLSQLLFSTLTDVDTNIVNVGLDGSNNIYVAAPDAVRKYAPDGAHPLWERDFASASFLQFAVTPSGTAFLFGSAPPTYPTLNGTQACGANLLEPISGVAAPAGTYGFLMAIGPDGDTQYATFMAEEIPRFLPIIVSAGDGRTYALAEAFLPNGPNNRWQGIVRFDPDALPPAHTSAGCLVHSATLLVSPIAPGTIMAIFGEQIGPETGTSFALQDGQVPFDIAGASITVDGKPAPVLYAQAGQINFIAPWSLRTDGTRVPVCITMNAANSCLYAATAPIAPGLFMVNSQIAAINPDGTINSPQHPAPSRSYVSVYMTGGGQIQGPMVDGGVAGFDLQRILAADTAVFTASVCEPFGGCNAIPLDAHILFDGAVPTLVYGVDVVIVDVPPFDSPFGTQQAKFTFTLRATPEGPVSTASGFLYIR